MKRIILVISLLLVSGCISQDGSMAGYESMSFETSDRFTIYSDFYPKEGAKPVILLHQLGKDRAGWRELASELSKRYAVVAIDMRGHGQSIIQNGVARPYTSFSPSDYTDMVKDVDAASQFLEIAGYDTSKTAVIGASIGANVALAAAALDKSIAEVVLLSPGLVYSGVNAEQAAYRYRGPSLIMASEGDQYSADSSRALAGIMEGSTLKTYPGSAHGMEMAGNPEARRLILGWLEDNFG